MTCEDLGWVARHILFSLRSWRDDGPRVLLKGIIGPSLHPLSKMCAVPSFFLLLADINFTSPDSLMKIMVSQKVFFFLCLKAICTLLRKVPDHGKPFHSKDSDHSAVSDLSRALVVLVCPIPSCHFLSLLSTIMTLMVILALR